MRVKEKTERFRHAEGYWKVRIISEVLSTREDVGRPAKYLAKQSASWTQLSTARTSINPE